MKKIKNKFGLDELKKYFINYKKVTDYNFTEWELKEIKNDFDKEDDFIYFTIHELCKRSYKFRNVSVNIDFTDDFLELLHGISKKQLWLNYDIFESILVDYFADLINEQRG
jgi:hypothetical protein